MRSNGVRHHLSERRGLVPFFALRVGPDPFLQAQMVPDPCLFHIPLP